MRCALHPVLASSCEEGLELDARFARGIFAQNRVSAKMIFRIFAACGPQTLLKGFVGTGF
jgi:hypothetical protein